MFAQSWFSLFVLRSLRGSHVLLPCSRCKEDAMIMILERRVSEQLITCWLDSMAARSAPCTLHLFFNRDLRRAGIGNGVSQAYERK
ncbi:uncharacterized protein EI97DRAFT_435712 [Westerdykella ornata]|uniref:Secreted protein n=1 Tax=Westerdykella ornata TaxID=318751 RepID=A0A6A6JAZ8_WESOR|nr:uncharacterized protein EI97DRAFT_435712 [Westerdykella ornata]KAF2273790.1 hypothetical protein EI97DRAFT_435712 [Westerdykella ornata]